MARNNSGNKLGQKGKYSPEIVHEICNYIKAGNSYKDAATLVGISEATFYGWQQEFESDGVTPNPEFHLDFLEAMKKAEMECKARNIAFIQRAAEKTWQASAWWLERKYNNEYALKQIQEVSGGVDEHGKRRPVELLINAGQGFVPATLTLPSTPASSNAEIAATIQSTDLAQKS